MSRFERSICYVQRAIEGVFVDYQVQSVRCKSSPFDFLVDQLGLLSGILGS